MDLETNHAPIPYEDTRRLVGFRLTDKQGNELERGDMQWDEFTDRVRPSGLDPRVEEALHHLSKDVPLTLSVEHFHDIHITVEVANSAVEKGEDYTNWTFSSKYEFEDWAEENTRILDE